MANNKNRGLTPRVNFFDGQKVTESDMDAEQVYNRSVASGIISDFHGSGIVWEDRFDNLILLDTSSPGYYSDSLDNPSKNIMEAGSYDGVSISLDRGVSDTINGCRIEVGLSDSDASSGRPVSVLIVGFSFDGVDEEGRLVSEVLRFKDNGVAVSEHYFPIGMDSITPKKPYSVALSISDKLDSLVGFFGIKLKPTSSKDPYALRRMAISLVRLII